MPAKVDSDSKNLNINNNKTIIMEKMKVLVQSNVDKIQFDNLNDKSLDQITMEDIVQRVTYCVSKVVQFPVIEFKLA